MQGFDSARIMVFLTSFQVNTFFKKKYDIALRHSKFLCMLYLMACYIIYIYIANYIYYPSTSLIILVNDMTSEKCKP